MTFQKEVKMMEKKTVKIVSIVFIATMLFSAIFVTSMKTVTYGISSSNTTRSDSDLITILSNGTIVPNNGVITTTDYTTYTIQSDTNMSVDVQRSNIFLNGNGHILRCAGQNSGIGIDANNVTITDLTIRDFPGAGLGGSVVSYVQVYDCTFINNSYGIYLFDDQNSFIYNNQFLGLSSGQAGIGLDTCIANINIAYNNFDPQNGGYGISLYSGETFVFRNNFTSAYTYVETPNSINDIFTRNVFINSHLSLNGNYGNDTVYHNDFINSSTIEDYIASPYSDTFDKGYPSCGNFWASHNLTDVMKGKYQNESGSDHIADNVYHVTSNNTLEVDHYPLNITYLSYGDSVLVKYLNLSDVNDDGVVNMRDIAAAVSASGTKPGDTSWNWFADINGDFKVNNADITWIQQNFGKHFP
jgi:parallel beta-helix repeat protein